ncbi:MAG: glycosyltransferase family 4 protein [Actinomycetota bacterium]
MTSQTPTPTLDPLRLVVNDYGGHPFPVDLSRELARRGHDVTHLHAGVNVTPRGDLSEDGGRLRIRALGVGDRPFDKYDIAARLRSDLRYGWRSGRVLARIRPDVAIASDMPVVSSLVARAVGRLFGVRSVLWAQDVQSGLAAMALGSERHLAVRALRWLERRLVRGSDHIVAISEQFAAELSALGADAVRTTVIENWAPIRQLPVRRRTNRWCRLHDLEDNTVFLYSGTLGIKHRPDALLELARALQAEVPDGVLVVVAEGVGADWLTDALAAEPELTNVRLLPLQAFEDLADVHGAADVLVVLLDTAVERYSVPGKLFGYLCARRPILGLVPADNSASTLIGSRAMAGLVSDDPDLFLTDALLLARDRELRHTYGKAGRAWAEVNFSIRRITDRFEDVLAAATGRVS